MSAAAELRAQSNEIVTATFTDNAACSRTAEEQALDLRARLESLSRVTSSVAHDVNNALGAVQTYASSALRSAGDPGLRVELEALEAALRNAVARVSELGRAARSERRHAGVIDLTAVLRRCLDRVRPRLDGIDLHLPGRAVWTVRGAREHVLERVLGQMVDTAVPNRTIDIRVTHFSASARPGDRPDASLGDGTIEVAVSPVAGNSAFDIVERCDAMAAALRGTMRCEDLPDGQVAVVLSLPAGPKLPAPPAKVAVLAHDAVTRVRAAEIVRQLADVVDAHGTDRFDALVLDPGAAGTSDGVTVGDLVLSGPVVTLPSDFDDEWLLRELENVLDV